MKILVFSDSRGAHRPAGSTHAIYASRLAKVPGLSVTKLLCPYKWTTIPDFLHVVETMEAYNTANYDKVILHAGIVDHSPRCVSQMLGGLLDPEDITPPAQAAEWLAVRNFTKHKIVNRKRPLLENLFGASALDDHYANPFPDLYEGDRTINLYSTSMLLDAIVPRLQAIKNLVFISSNTFCEGWRGDFGKDRPINIRMIEDYSWSLCRELPEVINLHQWSPDEVKKFTCDNLHLTAHGSDWVFLRLMELLGLRRRDYTKARKTVGAPARSTPWPLHSVAPASDLKSVVMSEPAVLSRADAETIKREYTDGKPLATLIIGVRLKPNDASRLENLKFLLQWIDRHYSNLFETLVVEQDKEQTADFRDVVPGNYRYAFLYNPDAYNRGWLYNVAAKHLTDARVVAFLDTDVLPGGNFIDCVIDCHKKFDAISPNRNLFYSTEEQKRSVIETGSYAGIPVTKQDLKNPTTFAGAMLVCKRDRFLGIGGFEQYVGYGCEDRALDVSMIALFGPDHIRMDSMAYFHLHHPVGGDERAYFPDIYAHMVEHYGCELTKGLDPLAYVHQQCCHSQAAEVLRQAEARIPHIGDPEMYRNHGFLTVNGLPPTGSGVLVPVSRPEPVFPPNFGNLRDYNEKEEFLGRYAAGWAPPVPAELAGPDTEELEFFYNRYRGKRCFIIGNGPSLNKLDLSLLKDEYTFGVNSLYYKTRETGFKPTFFVVEDSSVIKENVDEIVAYDPPFKFFPSIYKSLHPKKAGTYFFKINRGFYEKSSPNYAIPRFSTDITKGAYCGQSVTYVNLQLAFYMGFTEVFLIGMDFSYTIPGSHKRTGDVLLSDTDDPNHFHKDYFGKGKTWKDPKLDRVLMNYKMADLVYKCAGRRIFNATAGGKLEAFERVEFTGLFRGLDKSYRSEPLDLARPPDPSSRPSPEPPAPSAKPPATPPPAIRGSSVQPPRRRESADSIAAANRLFATRHFSECADMCERLFRARGLRMYRELADRAKQRAKHSEDEGSVRTTKSNADHAPPTQTGAPRRPSEDSCPTEFTSLSEYKDKEFYKSAPPPDSLEIATFHNAYRGHRCFIIGNGPSLNKHDLSLLEDEYTFGVNSLFYKTRETGFMPFFFVVEDSSVMKENIEEIRNYDAPFKFFPTNYRKLHPKQPNTFFFRMNRGFYEPSSPNFVVPRFSTDAADVLYCGQSVTYINLQLAYFMGFEEVYLIGMDFSYEIPASHERKGDLLLSNTDDPNHFHKDYFGKGKTWKDPKLDRVALNFRMAKLAYEAAGRKIYNATIGGRLEIFPRVQYADLFKRLESRSARSKFSADHTTARLPEVGAPEGNDSIAAANRLFARGRYLESAAMCDRLHQGRGLKVYRDLAGSARQHARAP